MEYTITWGGDPEDLCMTTSGVATVSGLDSMWRDAVADPRWAEGMKMLVDHTSLDWTKMSGYDVRERAAMLKQLSDQIGHQQVAWVLDDSESLLLGRLMGYMLDWEVQFVARYFTSVDDAREWLREPHELPHVSPPP